MWEASPALYPQEKPLCTMFTFPGDVSVKVFDGRIRSFPHVRGNWATYVFIPILLVNYEELGLVQFAAFIQDYFR